MNYTEKGSRSYLFSIVLVAVLGGLLFGYDTAVISGAEKGLQAFFMGADDFVYTDSWHGITSSSALLGCIIGSALSGFFASHFGRKLSLLIAGVMFFLSALGSYHPEFLIFPYGEPSYSLLLAFNFYRVIGGVGVGLASAICPMYIAEIAPSSIRGTLVSWNQFAIIFGQLVVYFVNFLILGDHLNPVVEIVDGVNRIINPEAAAWSIETGWRLMFVSEAVPAGLFTLLVLFVPETPRYLAMTGRDEKALFVLSRINGLSQGKEILQEIKATAHEKTEKLFTYGWMVIFIGIMLSVFQQAVGINAVLYFAPRIFESMGMGNPMVQTVFMGIVNILFTLLAVFSCLYCRKVGTQASAHLRFHWYGHRCTRSSPQQCRDRHQPYDTRHQHHGLQCFIYVQLGPHLLGTHRRDIPQYYPWRSRSHCCRFPVDIQFYRLIYLPAHVQHEYR